MTRVELGVFFDRIGGSTVMPQLKRLVLDMAIRGDFDPHESSQLTLEALEHEIRSSRGSDGKKSRTTNCPDPISTAERPAIYARHGHFVRLRDIADLRKGPTGIKDARPGHYPFVVTAEQRSTCDHYDFDGSAVVIPMVSSTGHGDASLKRIHYQEGRFAVGSILCAVLPIRPELISARYLYEYLSAFKDELLVARMIGTANVSLTVSKVGEIPVPLATPHAQRRVEDLMKLCDALEENGRLADEHHARLSATLFGALCGSQSDLEVRENWQRIAEHFDLLVDRPKATEALDQAILQLALRGLLVAQRPDEQTAVQLLARISVEIENYRTEKRVQAWNPDPIPNEATPFEVPSGWLWVRLGSLFKVVTDGDHLPPPKSESGVAFLTIGNVSSGFVDFTDCRHVPQSYYDGIAEYRRPKRGDILYTVVGATYGRPVVVDTDKAFCVQRHIAILKPDAEMNLVFLRLLMQSPLVYMQATQSITGTAQPTVALRPLRNFLLPLPPLAEQHRIVARVEELRRLCADLRGKLTEARGTQAALADALVATVA